MAAEVNALSKAYDLTKWMAERVARFPKSHHYTVGQRLVNTLLDVQDLLIEAHYSREKQMLLRRRARCVAIGTDLGWGSLRTLCTA